MSPVPSGENSHADAHAFQGHGDADGGLLVTGGGVASADNIPNTLDASVDAAAGDDADVGGANGRPAYLVGKRRRQNGCNRRGSTTLGLRRQLLQHIRAPPSAPSSLTSRQLQRRHGPHGHPGAQGSATISVAPTSNTTAEHVQPHAGQLSRSPSPAGPTRHPSMSVDRRERRRVLCDRARCRPCACSVVRRRDRTHRARHAHAIDRPYALDGLGTVTVDLLVHRRRRPQRQRHGQLRIVDTAAARDLLRAQYRSTPAGATVGSVPTSPDWTVTEPESHSSRDDRLRRPGHHGGSVR